MAQKIPFFDLFHSLPLEWDLRVQLDGAYLTAVELEQGKRNLSAALTVRADLQDGREKLAAAIQEAYQLNEVRLHQTVVEVSKQEAGGKKKAGGGDIIMGSVIKGQVQPMEGLNPKMGNVVVAGKVFSSDFRETRRPGVFLLTFDITDFHTSVRIVKLMQKEEKAALKKDIKPGMWLKVQGYVKLSGQQSDQAGGVLGTSRYRHHGPRRRPGLPGCLALGR